MKCCGKEAATRFCPDCGTKLKAHDIGTLMGFARHRLKIVTVRASQTLTQEQKHKAEKSLNKWTEWVKALEEAMSNKHKP